MMICYNTQYGKTTKDFSSIEMVLTTKGSFFSPALYDIVGVAGVERVVLYKGVKEKKARHYIGLINFSCANTMWGGGIYYI